MGGEALERMDEMCDLGLTINKDKIEEPKHKMNCLGIMVNARSGELTIPITKLCEVKQMSFLWRQRRYGTRKSLRKLLGHLLYIHHCEALCSGHSYTFYYTCDYIR